MASRHGKDWRIKSVNSLVKRQKLNTDVSRKQNTPKKTGKKRTFLTPPPPPPPHPPPPLIRTRTCAYQWVRNIRFLGKFGMLCFPKRAVLRFALLPYYRRINSFNSISSKNITLFCNALEIWWIPRHLWWNFILCEKS